MQGLGSKGRFCAAILRMVIKDMVDGVDVEILCACDVLDREWGLC